MIIGSPGKGALEIRGVLRGEVDDAGSRTFVEYEVGNKKTHQGEDLTREQLEDPKRIITDITSGKEQGVLINDVSYAERDMLTLSQEQMRFSDQCMDAVKNEGVGAG